MDTATGTEPNARKCSRRTGWRWRLIRLVRAAAIAYLLVLCLLPFAQTYIAFPGSFAPAAQAPPLLDTEPFALATPDGSEIAGVLLPFSKSAQLNRKLPTILYFYGNASTVAHSRQQLELFRESGANVMVVDYPGYGASAGTVSEASIRQAADALWSFAVRNPNVDERQIVLAGWSLGGAVAIDLAARRPAAGVMTLCAFTSMDEMAHRTVPFMPTSLLLQHHFTSIRKLASSHIPIMIIHGDRDRVVPFPMARRLADAASTPPRCVSYIAIQGADHDDIFGIGHDQISDALRQLLVLVKLRAASGDAPQ